MTAQLPLRLPSRMAAPLVRLHVPPGLRGAIAIGLVLGFLVFPWGVSGPVTYDASDPRLVYSAPSLTGSAAFDPANRSVSLIVDGADGPRVDFVASESSFVFQADAMVVDQTIKEQRDWLWVRALANRPTNAAYYTLTLQAGEPGVLDVRLIQVVDAANPASVVHTFDFANKTEGWTLYNDAAFVPGGNPPTVLLQLKGNDEVVPTARTTNALPLSASIASVDVLALIRFEGEPGRFKIGTEWFTPTLDHIRYDTEWDEWAAYGKVPSPLTWALWFPGSPLSARLRFDALDGAIGRIILEVLSAGQVRYNTSAGSYAAGEPLHMVAKWAKGTALGFEITHASGTIFSWLSSGFPKVPTVAALATITHLGLSLSAQGVGRLTSTAVVRNATYQFPGSARFADLSADPLPLLAAGGILVGLGFLYWEDFRGWAQRTRAKARRISKGALGTLLRRHYLALIIAALVAGLYWTLALDFAGHPFDQIVFKTWIYSGQRDGLQGIYGRSSSVGDAFVRGDHQPWSSLGFAYTPLAAYLFYGLGHLLPDLHSYLDMSSLFSAAPLEAQVKMALASFTLAAGLLLYGLVRRSTGSARRAHLALIIFLLNPAIIYDSAVWGETDSFLYLAFLIFAWAAAGRRPALALGVFLLAIAFKQTGLLLMLPAALIALAPGTRPLDRLSAWGKAATVLLAGMVPLLVGGVLPSALFKPIVTKLADVGTSAGDVVPLVSPDTYTPWTLFTALHGATGVDRLLYPANLPLVAGISFSGMGLIAFILVSYKVFTAARPRIPPADLAFWNACVAGGALIFITLVTGAASRYYTLALPGLITAAAVGWDRLNKAQRRAALAVTLLVTVVSFWTMMGLFTIIVTRDVPDLRGLQLPGNPVMAFVARWYLNDVVITLGSLASIALLVLAVRFTFYFTRRTSPSTAAASNPWARLRELLLGRGP